MPDNVVELKIKGLDELQRRLERIGKKVATNIFRVALRKAGRLIVNAFVTNAPRYVGPPNKGVPVGFLAEHFGTRTKIIRDGIAGSIFVGPEGKIDFPDRTGEYRKKIDRHGKSSNVGRVSVASVARFLEYGTVHEKKNPFMSRAWESVKQQALKVVIDAIKDGLDDKESS